MYETKSDVDMVAWAIRCSRSRAKKSYPWHELQEIAFALEHGMCEADALQTAALTPEPLSEVLPPTGRQKHDTLRVAHLRALISETSWSHAERNYDEAELRARLRLPVRPQPDEPES